MSLPFHHSVLRALSLRSRHCEVPKKLTPADVRGRGARSQYCLSLKVPFPGLGNDVKVQLHPEVVVNVKVNVARSPEEAEMQASGVDVMQQVFEEGRDQGGFVEAYDPNAEPGATAEVQQEQAQG